jgi:hypothetical protein
LLVVRSHLFKLPQACKTLIMILVILFTTTILNVLYYYKCAVCSLQYRKENKVFYRLSLSLSLSFSSCYTNINFLFASMKFLTNFENAYWDPPENSLRSLDWQKQPIYWRRTSLVPPHFCTSRNIPLRLVSGRLEAGLEIKKLTQKNQKNHLKKTQIVFFGVFWVFFKFFIFYENNTNFSLWNRFLMNKSDINYHLFAKK